MITVSILIYFIIFATVLLLSIRDANIKQKTKILLVTLFFASAIFTHKSITSQHGYSVYSENIPEGQIVAIEIVNPNGIYLWLYEKNVSKAFLDYVLFRDVIKQPRAYRIEYNEERAKKYNEMKKKMQKGYVVEKVKPNKKSTSEADNLMIDKHRYIFTDPRNMLKKD